MPQWTQYYCDGKVFFTWLKDNFPDPLFTEMANKDVNFMPHQSVDEATMLGPDGIAHELCMNERCRHVAKTLLL